MDAVLKTTFVLLRHSHVSEGILVVVVVLQTFAINGVRGKELPDVILCWLFATLLADQIAADQVEPAFELLLGIRPRRELSLLLLLQTSVQLPFSMRLQSVLVLQSPFLANDTLVLFQVLEEAFGSSDEAVVQRKHLRSPLHHGVVHSHCQRGVYHMDSVKRLVRSKFPVELILFWEAIVAHDLEHAHVQASHGVCVDGRSWAIDGLFFSKAVPLEQRLLCLARVLVPNADLLIALLLLILHKFLQCILPFLNALHKELFLLLEILLFLPSDSFFFNGSLPQLLNVEIVPLLVVHVILLVVLLVVLVVLLQACLLCTSLYLHFLLLIDSRMLNPLQSCCSLFCFGSIQSLGCFYLSHSDGLRYKAFKVWLLLL